jgi:hypothetical protein
MEADLNVRNEKGRSLLEIVKSQGEAELAAYLASRGARIPSGNGKQPSSDAQNALRKGSSWQLAPCP